MVEANSELSSDENTSSDTRFTDNNLADTASNQYLVES